MNFRSYIFLGLALLPSPATIVEAADENSASKADVEALVHSNNQFAVDLYRKIAGKPGDICLCPLSVSSLFALVSAGARGETAQEIHKALNLGESPQQTIDQSFRSLRNALIARDDDNDFSIANGIWMAKETVSQKAFLENSKQFYDAELSPLDFAGNADAARKTINAWIENQTHHKIKNMLDPGSLDAQSAFVLVNAVYFSGKWLTEFKPEASKIANFQSATGGKCSAVMMHQMTYFQFSEDEVCQVLEMPYLGEKFSMVLLLPASVEALPALEKALTCEWLQKRLTKLQKTAVAVSMPKFRVASRIDLTDYLSALGVKLAFQAGRADFSLVAESKKFFISYAAQRTFLSASETGSIAAAATAVALSKNGGNHPVPFTADHPFIYLIRDTKSGSLVFIGRVSETPSRHSQSDFGDPPGEE